MIRSKSIFIISVLVCTMFTGSIISMADPLPNRAPNVPIVQTDMPAGRGFMPKSLDLSHLNNKGTPGIFMAVQTPASWDWRESGKVTSVKNQSSCGACYSFAALANIEARVLIGDSETFDFSENNAKECNFEQTSCDGGNFYDMASFLSQKGTVLESCDPYVAADVTCNSSCAYIKTLLDWRIISTNAIPSTQDLKDYIYNYGPIYTSMYAGDGNDNSWLSEINGYDGSYTMHYSGTWPTNHAVTIVGWDDNLSHAGGTGAWIVKNSWGNSWGGTCGYGSEEGYFTIAYGSANIGQWSSFVYDWQDYDNNDDILYYDENGWTSSWGYNPSTTAWGMCKFVVPSTHYLTRVDLWTNDVTTDIDVYVYDNYNGVSLSSLLTSELNSGFLEAGYHSIALSSPPQVSAGEDVYVAIKITNASYTFPIVADTVSPAESATTYISSTGSGWYDLGNGQGDDVAFRLRTSPSLVSAVDDDNDPTKMTYALSQNYPNPFNPSTTINYTLETRSQVTISIYNFLGQKINTIVDQIRPAGSYNVEWDGDNFEGKAVATGIYFYKIVTDDFTETKKMLLLK
ncbi:MAG: T9SS type A sorting domain-containing protein [FCB group bacterium]|nr:T9SS type A sorting domain-containing protein [FCB group bacterium]